MKKPRQNSAHMSMEEFRRRGHQLIDWVAEYYENVESYPVCAQTNPGEVCAALPESAPLTGESFDAVLADVERIIMPAVTHWQSPNFFAYFPANTSGPAILGDLLSSGLGVQGMMWLTSPACTELETRVLDWVVDMLALPERFKSSGAGGGVIQDSASSATLCALLAARERATGNSSNATGVTDGLVVYASTQTHSSMEKAVAIAGIGRDNLRLIAVDENFALRAPDLAARVSADRAAGLRPAFVCATVGTTASLAVDPIEEIGAICSAENIWLHVDAAMAGTAAVCPEHRQMHKGLERADSYCFNPHKWMFTNFDCDCFFVADRSALINALSVLPEYLRNVATESGDVIDYRDWQIPLGRRFRALKLWFVIRHYGVNGLRQHIRRHIELANEFREWVENDERFELTAPPNLNLVCFRMRGEDVTNKQLLEAVNKTGRLYLSHAVLADRYSLRFCVGQTATERQHVSAAWRTITEVAERLR